MSIPSYVIVGGLTYRVVHSDLLSDDNCRGKCYHEQQEIHISTNLTEHQKEITFIHECIHAMLEIYGAGTAKELSEEEICEVLDGAIWNLLKDNKEVFTP